MAELSILADATHNTMIEQPVSETVRSKIIESRSYGLINCLEVGEYGQPLILVIHGSGPKNCAKAYEFFLYEYLARISFLERFYIIAIDCPGYGQSTGSKEAIKTFPRQLLQEILEALRYNNYFILMGHSQGGAAIFNAVYEKPTLCEIMVQERPVCGNIQRFRGFQVPTLLIYDIEDDGHPIWQGKLLYKELKNSEFYTFRSSQTPYWVSDHLWDHILQFINRWVRNSGSSVKNGIRAASLNRSNSVRSRPRSNQSRVNRSLDRRPTIRRPPEPRVERVTEKIEEMSQMSESVTPEQMREIQEIEQSFCSSSSGQRPVNMVRKPVQAPEVQKPVKQSPPKEKLQELSKQMPKQLPKQREVQKVRPSTSKPSPTTVVQPVESQPAVLTPPVAVGESKEDAHRCSLCLQTFFHPIQTNCSHVFCSKCITEALLVNHRCPLCRRAVTTQHQLKDLHSQLIGEMSASVLQQRGAEHSRFQKMMQSIVFVEIGNNSVELQTKQSAFTKTKKKYNWELFAIEPRNFKFEYVEFNINMGQPNSKPVRVKSPPWVYESRGTFGFSCEIKIAPRSTDYAAKTIVYRIDIQPGRHSQKVALRKKQFERVNV